jgi:hypothetical protein
MSVVVLSSKVARCAELSIAAVCAVVVVAAADGDDDAGPAAAEPQPIPQRQQMPKACAKMCGGATASARAQPS